MRCAKCGKEEMLPYRCAYCNQHHCSIHRLPEQHECSSIQLARSPSEIRFREEVRGERRWTRPSISSPLITITRGWYKRGQRELVHLSIGTLLVLGVGLSLFGFMHSNPLLVAMMVIAFTFSFLIHEMAHKYTALRYNCWAQFRLNLMGAILTASSIILPIKFIAPGAVVLFGGTTPRSLVRIAAAGPITNILLAMGSILAIVILRAAPPLGPSLLDALFFLSTIGYFNALIALFNLLPFGPLDGLKIYYGSPRTWVSLFAPSLLLFVIFTLRPF